MPLVGNPSLAALLYGAPVTFVYEATVTTTVAVSAATASDNSLEKTIAAQEASQLTMDRTMPGTLYLAVGGLILFVMVISHPRFLARFFASFPSRKDSKPAVKSLPAYRGQDGDRSVGRIVGGGDLCEGWVLKRGNSSNIALHSPSAFANDSPENSQSFSNEKGHLFSRERGRHILSPPPRIVPFLSSMPFSSFLLSTPFYRSSSCVLKSLLTVTEIYIIGGYLLLNAFAIIWRSDLSPASETSGYGADFKRSGNIAMAQVPLVVALGCRGNLIGLCIGQGYERLKLYHKVFGRVMFIAATIHVAGYVYTWAAAGNFAAHSKKQFAVCGFLAYASFVLIIISSLPWVRKACYQVFKFCHVVGIAGVIIGLAWHVEEAIPFCVAASVFYLISTVCSLIKIRLASAQIRALIGSESTEITIPALRSGWRAGQHVRLRVPGLGVCHGFEAHPFTIASAADGEGMVLICKRTGDWTRRLFDFSRSLEDGSVGHEHRKGRRTTVIIEGPWGGLGNTMLPSFSAVVLFAGGSGITHALSLAHDLVTRAPTGCVRARTIDLVWMIKTEREAEPFIPRLVELVWEAKRWEEACLDRLYRREYSPQPTALRIKIFVTRCPPSSPLTLIHPALLCSPGIKLSRVERAIEGGKATLKRQPSAAESEKMAYLARHPSAASIMSAKARRRLPLSTIVANSARPNLHTLLSYIMDETIISQGHSLSDHSGLYVSACGPAGLVHGAMTAVRNLESDKTARVGGVEFEQEHYGF